VALDRWPGRPGAGRPGAGRDGRTDGRLELADSKVLTARAREAAYREIVRLALAWGVVVIEPSDIDRLGLHVCNVAGMRRALACLPVRPGYVLTDGFEVPGLAVPALAMWKGDQVAACVAAASIVAKETRDKIMKTLDADYPQYGFARHKGYSTSSHMAAIDEWGPSPVHRRSFVNVSSRVRLAGAPEFGNEIDVGTIAALDDWRDGPIVELIASSLTTRLAGTAGLARPDACASSEGEHERGGSRKYETEMELQLYREYRDVVGLFSHVVETERRFYLTNDVDLKVRTADNGEVFFEVTMHDAWVWDMYRPARFVKNVRVVTFKDVNIEELAKSELQLPEDS
jgi:ribonuclease HII